MKYSITVEGDLYEDSDYLKNFAHMKEILSVIEEASQKIRSEIKYGFHTEKTIQVLQEINSILCIHGLDD